MAKELAVDAEGNMSWCSVPADQRGSGNCPHSIHSKEGESKEDFLNRAEEHSRYSSKEQLIDEPEKQNPLKNLEPFSYQADGTESTVELKEFQDRTEILNSTITSGEVVSIVSEKDLSRYKTDEDTQLRVQALLSAHQSEMDLLEVEDREDGYEERPKPVMKLLRTDEFSDIAEGGKVYSEESIKKFVPNAPAELVTDLKNYMELCDDSDFKRIIRPRSLKSATEFANSGEVLDFWYEADEDDKPTLYAVSIDMA